MSNKKDIMKKTQKEIDKACPEQTRLTHEDKEILDRYTEDRRKARQAKEKE